MRHLCVLSVALLIVLSSSGTIFAQDSSAVQPISLREGMNALQFQIGQNFTLRSFQGATFSLKRQTSDNSAQRFSVTLSIGDGSNESDIHTTDTSFTTESRSETNIGGTLSFTLLYYLPAVNDIHIYYGVGPSAGYSHSHTASSNVHHYSSTHSNTTDGTMDGHSWSVGALGVFGAEWFVSRSISLTAEYTGSLSYTWSTSTTISGYSSIYQTSNPQVQIERREMNSHGFYFAGNYVGFGLSAYF